MREFEQMEMQFFVRPGEEMEWFKKWKATRLKWHQALGLGDEKYRYHDHDKLAHYANAATDIEFEMPFGFKEVEGIHSRTNFDLSQHEKFSGKKIQYFDPELNQSLYSVCNRDLYRCRPCVLEHDGRFLLRRDIGKWRKHVLY